MQQDTKIHINLQGLELHGKNENPPKENIRDTYIITKYLPWPYRLWYKKEEIPVEKIEISDPSNEEKIWKLTFASLTWIANKTEEIIESRGETEWNDAWEEIAIEEIKNQNKQEKEIWEQKNRKENKKEIKFTNYRSHFKEESDNIIQKIQKFRYGPKTRLWFIFGIISLTAMTVLSLMHFFPERHSIDIYKTSILDLYSVALRQETNTWDSNELSDATGEWDPNTAEWETDELWDNTAGWEEEINREMEQAKIEIEVEKIRNHLLNSYK